MSPPAPRALVVLSMATALSLMAGVPSPPPLPDLNEAEVKGTTVVQTGDLGSMLAR
jgi:hypothetical protein